MALATLYSAALRKERSLPNCHGLIVDHRARPESTEEAQWVAEQLHSKCMAVYQFQGSCLTLRSEYAVLDYSYNMARRHRPK